MRRILLLGSCLVLLAHSAGAASFSEGPDYSEDPNSPTFLGSLDFGANTVSGSINSATLAGDPGDAFSFSIPALLAVSSVTVTVSSFSSSGGRQGLARDPLDANILDHVIAANGVSPELLLSQFGNGTFVYEVLDPDGLGLLANVSFSYTVSFTTVAVPEPGTGMLLLCGLAGLAALRRNPR